MQKLNGKPDGLVDRIGWGLFLILIGMLFLAENQGWIKDDGWSYFALGMGGILSLSALATLLLGQNRGWKISERLAIGVALVFVGMALLFGIGDWWPLALIPVGLIHLAKGFWGYKNTGVEIHKLSN